jgi:hypothetical protein
MGGGFIILVCNLRSGVHAHWTRQETADAHLEEKVYMPAARDARQGLGQGTPAASRMLTWRHHAHRTSLAVVWSRVPHKACVVTGRRQTWAPK